MTERRAVLDELAERLKIGSAFAVARIDRWKRIESAAREYMEARDLFLATVTHPSIQIEAVRELGIPMEQAEARLRKALEE